MAASKTKTLNGRPTSVTELNLGSPIDVPQTRGLWARVSAALNRLNLVLAGMYTGVTCYGVPHEDHSYSEEADEEKGSSKN